MPNKTALISAERVGLRTAARSTSIWGHPTSLLTLCHQLTVMRIHLAAILVLVLATAVLARIPASLASSGVGGPMERSSFAKNLDHSQHHSKSHHSTSSGHHAKGHHSKVSTVTSPSTDSDAIDGAQRSSSEASSLLESASSKHPASDTPSPTSEEIKSADDAAASIELGFWGMQSGSYLIALSAVVVAGALFA